MKHTLLKTFVLGGLAALLVISNTAAHPTNLQATPTATPLPSITLSGHTSAVTDLAWSADGRVLASSAGSFDSQDNTVRLWQADGKALAELTDHKMPVFALAWSPAGSMLATGSEDQTVKLWQPDGTLLKTFQAKTGIVFALAWSPDGKTLASGSIASPTSNTIQLWNTDGQLLNTLTTQFSGGKFYNLAWSPDGQYLVGGATDYREWKADGTLVFSDKGCAHCTPAWGFGWSPDSLMWMIGNESGLSWVYGADGHEITQLESTDDVGAIQWSPDGQWMAAGKDLWRVTGSKFVLKNYVKGPDGALSWSPDSRLIASNGGKVVYIQQADGKLVTMLKGHTEQVDSLAWSPNGDVLASGLADSTIRLWDVASLHN